MFRGLLEVADVRARLLALDDGERRLTNLLHLGGLCHTAERNEHLDRRASSTGSRASAPVAGRAPARRRPRSVSRATSGW
jgi:hypothetical protein